MTIQFDFCGDSGEVTVNTINKIRAAFCFDVHGWEIFFIREGGKSSKIFCTSFEIIG